MVATLGVVALSNLALLVFIAAVLWDAPELQGTLERRSGEQGCHWALVPDALSSTGAGEVVPLPPDETAWCIHRLAGVPLRSTSLVTEPGYLESGEQLEAWFEDRAALYQALEGRQRVEVEFMGESRTPLRMTLPLVRGGPDRGWTLLVLAGLTGIALLSVGGFVLLVRPRRPEARALAAMCQAAFLCLVISGANAAAGLAMLPWASRLLYQLNVAGMALLGSALLLLLSWFPEPWPRHGVARVVRPAVVAITASLLVAELSGALFQGVLSWTLACFLGTLLMLVRAAFTVTGQVPRLQLRWMLWGFGSPLAVVLVVVAPTVLFPSPSSNPTETVAILACIAGPVGIGFGILRYRLLDIEVVIRRTILGMVVVTAFSLVYHLAVALLAGRLSGGVGEQLPGFLPVFLTALLFTFLLQPLQGYLSSMQDRWFFRNQYDYRLLLARVGEELVSAGTPHDAADTLLRIITSSMQVGRAAIFVRPGRLIAGPWVGGAVSPPIGEEFWGEIDAQVDPLLADERVLRGSLQPWLAHNGLVLLIPMRVSEAVIGFFACSAPQGGKPLSRADVSLLGNAVASLALTISHAEALAEVQRMNEELEDRVQRRTAELEQTRTQLYQSDKMASVGILAAGVAHELNTPLGVVASSSDQLREVVLSSAEPGIDEVAALAGLCHKAAKRAAGIVENLRDFSRPSQKDPELLDVAESIDTTLQLLGSTLRKRQIVVQKAFRPVPRLFCYPALLHQVFMNLLLNAAQAIERHGVIRIELEPAEDGGVRIAVTDDGPGIPEQDRKRIFDPFFTTREVQQGTGLGLSLCYNIVRAHGGQIELDADHEDGARFVVQLPPRIEPSAVQEEGR